MNGFQDLWSFAARYLGHVRGSEARGVVSDLLVLVFLWSGATKMRRPWLAALAIKDFGVTDRIRPRFGLALGFLELSLAGLLAFEVSTRYTSVLMAVVLWLFSWLIVRSLRSGMRFECFCFGESGSELSGFTLARAAGLALLATWLASSSGAEEGPTWSASGLLQIATAMSLLGAVVVLGDFIRIRALAPV